MSRIGHSRLVLVDGCHPDRSQPVVHTPVSRLMCIELNALSPKLPLQGLSRRLRVVTMVIDDGGSPRTTEQALEPALLSERDFVVEGGRRLRRQSINRKWDVCHDKQV